VRWHPEEVPKKLIRPVDQMYLDSHKLAAPGSGGRAGSVTG
jgi:hypothetical protein